MRMITVMTTNQQKKIEDDEDDFDGPLDDLGYESFNDYDDDDDF